MRFGLGAGEAATPWLVPRLRRWCRNPELVRDVLQKTFLTTWKAAANYRGSGAALGWLWAVAAARPPAPTP
ncbi:RNA polymerase sigma factor [Micromonospora taraxaci]|uniref:RNA polymerase sigma factor n=1 Tax=Micromonospora taraxaci TaxID=1316803 RepID=UPI0033B160E7